MDYKLRKYHKNQDTLVLLERVRLSGPKLAEARFQLLRGEAMADLICGAWRLTVRALGAIAGKARALADSMANSAMRSGEHQRDAYLAQATDTADLEHRIRYWQARGYVFRGAGLRGR